MTEPADSPETNARVWRETFLARYPRKLKLGIVALLLLGIVLPPFAFHGKAPEPVAKEEGVRASFGPTLPSHAMPEETPADEKKTEASATTGASETLQPETQAETQPETQAASEATAERGGQAARDAETASNIQLAAAPDPGLVETTPEGPLPIVGGDGRQPWQVYARPFDLGDTRPRIAIVMDGLGLSRVATDAAIHQLPGTVTLAFDVHAPSLSSWMARARQDGHETLLTVPTEPIDYPRSDPGSHTLLSFMPAEGNKERLLWSLAQGTGYVGVMALAGQRFDSEPDRIARVLRELKNRGLMIVDGTLSRRNDMQDMTKGLHIPYAAATIRLDAVPTPEAIDSALTYLEQTARVGGAAIGLVSPLPLSMDRLDRWIRTLAARGIVLAPVTAVAH